MVFYKFSLKGSFEQVESSSETIPFQDKSSAKTDFKEYLSELNNNSEDYFGSRKKGCVIFTKGRKTRIDGVCAGGISSMKKEEVIRKLTKLFAETKGGRLEMLDSFEEISALSFKELVESANSESLPFHNRSIFSDLKIDYDDNNTFKVKEYMAETRVFSKKSAIKKGAELLGDETLFEELDRIYSQLNIQGFYGHPVHYLIKATSKESAEHIINLLVKALLSNKRLLSGRVEDVYDISTTAYDEEDLSNVIRGTFGGSVIFNMDTECEKDSNYASTYEDVVTFLDKEIKSACKDTLFFFIQKGEKNAFSKSLISSVEEYIDLVEIKEGFGDVKIASEYLNQLIKKSSVGKLNKTIEIPVLKKNKLYSVSDIYGVFNKWNDSCLKDQVYKAYKNRTKVLRKNKKKKESAISTLERMIGLKDIKEIARQIIAAGKVNALRTEKGIFDSRQSMHMIFTGNPGSAKTTVARLLAQALLEEGIISNDSFVECGRADLVGKYVGWTAPTVKKKFREASGGVLFIDEAYSLVDEKTGSFGDEAITTIVQEMENHRDDVIVIFAGYPDKMEKFLEANEGLRSRIAYYLDFPDYNNEELMGIFKLMLKDKNYETDDLCEKKVMDILKTVTKKKDFGNGRFVRNLIEQATMKQSLRLYNEYDGKKIPKSKLGILLADDFEVNAAEMKAKNTRKIGF